MCPKTKAGWVSKLVDVIASDHDTFIKSNLFSSVTFDVDVPNDPNIGTFIMKMFMFELKTLELFQLLLLDKQWRFFGS